VTFARTKVRYSPQLFIQLENANFDDLLKVDQKLLLVDPDDSQLTFEQNTILSAKGKTVFAYLSLGQAEKSRDYWQDSWQIGSPDFIHKVDPKYEYGFVVKFWTPEWENIILNYTAQHIAPFGYAGVLIDYMDEYKNFLTDRPNAAQEMVALGAKVVNVLQSRNPRMLILTQDSIDLYRIDKYRDMIDGVSCEEVFYKHSKNADGSLSFESQPSSYTASQMTLLDQILKDKKAVILMEYIEKNRYICQFYKKCAISGYICGVFDLNTPGLARECAAETVKF
jgi:uncharacterized protein (TIGR01370 family)